MRKKYQRQSANCAGDLFKMAVRSSRPIATNKYIQIQLYIAAYCEGWSRFGSGAVHCPDCFVSLAVSAVFVLKSCNGTLDSCVAPGDKVRYHA